MTSYATALDRAEQSRHRLARPTSRVRRERDTFDTVQRADALPELLAEALSAKPTHGSMPKNWTSLTTNATSAATALDGHERTNSWLRRTSVPAGLSGPTSQHTSASNAAAASPHDSTYTTTATDQPDRSTSATSDHTYQAQPPTERSNALSASGSIRPLPRPSERTAKRTSSRAVWRDLRLHVEPVRVDEEVVVLA